MSKQGIIDKIISDATIKSQSIVADAKEKADEIIAKTAEECKGYINNSTAETDKIVFDIEARSKTVAELDAKKLLLKAKKDVLDEVFALALDKLRNLDVERYSALIFAMLEEANDGDEIVISQREKDIVTKESLDEYASKRGIKLTLLPPSDDFDGGVIIKSNGVDKNLMLEVEIELLKENYEAQVAKEIFG